MKKNFRFWSLLALFLVASCTNRKEQTNTTTEPETTTTGGQAAVKDDESQKDVVKVALGSADHTTLVAALKQADLVDVLSNPGPFTVFAPTNAAFDKLPAGTLSDLMKNDKKADLQNILQYHVTTSSLKKDFFKDGQTLGMVNGDNVSISVKDGDVVLNNSAKIIASIQASNGMVHVIDAVLLPPQKNK